MIGHEHEFRCGDRVKIAGSPCKHYVRPETKGEPGFCAYPTRFRCTEAMKRLLPRISYSSMTSFIQCRRKYYYQVVEGLQLKPEHLPDSMKFGCAWDLITRSLHDGSDYAALTELRLSPEQAAKINALRRALVDLEVHINKDAQCQLKISTPIGTTQITGFVDRAYEDYIVETKFSSRPDFYQQKENVAYQLGTYFLANESWKSAVVEITRLPVFKTGVGKFTEETPEQFEERLYSDIIGRPAYYFIGWDRKMKRYGVRFWRNEFDLEEIFQTYVYVLKEIQETVTRGAWYRNILACHVPAACPFLPIKRTGVISSEIFEKRHLKGGESKNEDPK